MARRKKPQPKRRGPGRPRLLSGSKLRKEVCLALECGASRADVATYLGIDYDTLGREIKRDAEFRRQVESAEVDGKIWHLLKIREAASGDWRASKFFLERKHWREWAQHNPQNITPDQLANIISRIVAVVMTTVPAEFHAELGGKIEEILQGLDSRPNHDGNAGNH